VKQIRIRLYITQSSPWRTREAVTTVEAARRALSRGIYEGSGALAGLRNQNQNHGVVDQSVRSESEHNHNHNRTRTRARAIRTRARAIRTGVRIRIMALQKPICEQNTVPRSR